MGLRRYRDKRHYRRGGAIATAAFCGLAMSFLATQSAHADTKKANHPAVTTRSAAKPISAPIQLSYDYKAGDIRRYKLTAFFNGHIPQFGDSPVHLMIEMVYAAKVKKVAATGATVDFDVESAAVNLLEKEPAPGAKIVPAEMAELPLPLSQVQKTLNVTATFKPNGAVTDIKGGDASQVKIDLGIDLRKLFLVTAPIVFAEKPVKVGDTWPFDDGLLGNKPGKTNYLGKLVLASSNGKRVIATASQEATSSVDSKLDKEGNSTSQADAAVGTLSGNVTLHGTMEFAGSIEPGSNPSGPGGHLSVGTTVLTVNLRRTLPDPDNAGKQKTDAIDIVANLRVEPAPVAPPAKPAGENAKTEKTTTNPGGQGRKS